MNEQAAHREPAARTLREALGEHPAGPEVLAALGPLADRPLPVGWAQWAPARWEAYLDAALDQARARRLTPRSTRRAA